MKAEPGSPMLSVIDVTAGYGGESILHDVTVNVAANATSPPLGAVPSSARWNCFSRSCATTPRASECWDRLWMRR